MSNVDRARPRGAGAVSYAAHLFTVFSIALSNLFLSLALIGAFWRGKRGKAEAGKEEGGALARLQRSGSRPLLIALGAYVLLLLVSIAASYDPVSSLAAASELFTLAGVLLGLLFIRRAAVARWIVDGVVIFALLVAAVGLVQYLLGSSTLDSRIQGPLGHYMTFAGIVLLADALLVARVAVNGGWRKPWLWGGLAVLNVALAASYTRSSWVAVVLVVTLLLSVRAPKLLAAVPAAALVLFLLAPVPMLHRAWSIFDLRDGSNYDRICMARAGLTMIAEQPVLGQGPELVEVRYPIYRHPSAPRYWVPHLHNSFLQLAAERGLPALAAYLLMMSLSAAHALRRLRAEGGLAGPRADLYLGALLVLLAFNLAGLFEDNWGDTEVKRLALFALVLPYLPAAPEVEDGDGAGAETEESS